LRGRLVRTLLTEQRRAGRHEFEWNGRDDSGEPVASGVYLIRLETPTGHQEQKVSLLK
jgi:flagellar hook assembly protein FlgD